MNRATTGRTITKLSLYTYHSSLSLSFLSKPDQDVGDSCRFGAWREKNVALTKLYTPSKSDEMAVVSVNLKQQAYDRIRDWLRAGKLEPGTRVSTLNLSKQLGLSRTPVREALSRLASDGVMREVPGFGMYVHLPTEKELEELYGLREVLEVYASQLAAQHISPSQLEQLSELCLQWRAIARTLKGSPDRTLDARHQERWIRIDEKFHDVVLVAAGSALLHKAVDDMRLIARTLDCRRIQNTRFIDLASAARSIRDHVGLVRALERRDAAAAENWMRRQTTCGRERHLAEIRLRNASREVTRL